MRQVGRKEELDLLGQKARIKHRILPFQSLLCRVTCLLDVVMTVICKKHLELDLKKSALLDLNVKVTNSILILSVFSFCFPLRKVPSSSTITLLFSNHTLNYMRGFFMKSIMIVILFLCFPNRQRQQSFLFTGYLVYYFF